MRAYPGQSNLWRWNRKKYQTGGETVEFALLAVFNFLFLFGLIEFSLLVYDQGALQHAARVGAREASLYWVDITRMTAGTDPANDRCIKKSEVSDTITEFTDQFLFSLTGNRTVCPLLMGKSLSSSAACTGTGSPSAFDACRVVSSGVDQVDVSLSLATGAPVSGRLINLSSLLNMRLTAQAAKRVE